MKLTPFSKKELANKFQYIEFVERGQKMAILNILDKELVDRNTYKFGLIDDDNNLFWFFYGKPMVKKRIKALQTYKALQEYCEKNKIGKPFACKDF